MNTSLLLQAAYIDGAWLQAQDTVAVDNPATGDIIGHVPNLGTAAAEQAVSAAHAALADSKPPNSARAIAPRKPASASSGKLCKE